MTSIKGRIHGCIFGGAIGDALGSPVEFSSMEAIHGRYGDEGIQDLPENPLYTDDTQMTLRAASGLCNALETTDPVDWPDDDLAAQKVAEQFVEWLEVDPSRAPGVSCMFGVHNLAKGMYWMDSGKPDSKGCGTVMRSAPYGIMAQSPKQGALLAAMHSHMTHLHQAAHASAAALAAGIACLLEGHSQRRVVETMMAAAEQWDHRTSFLIACAWAKAPSMLVDPADVLRHWEGWTGDEAIAAAVYCWAKNPGDFQSTIRMAANSPGDSDSLAAIAGNLAGAELGVEAIPQDWLDRIENAPLLAEVGGRLYEGYRQLNPD